MSARLCSVEDCGRVHQARGYCKSHYNRLQTWGDVRADLPLRVRPQYPRRPGLLPEIAYVLNRIDRTPSGCWEWRGATNGIGYGVYTFCGQHDYSHRWLYRCCIGPIPQGYHVDHLCRNTLCCNPEHLEAVTVAENIRRSPLVGMKTHCKNGHEFTPANTYVSPAGARRCKACQQARAREANARRRDLFRVSDA